MSRCVRAVALRWPFWNVLATWDALYTAARALARPRPVPYGVHNWRPSTWASAARILAPPEGVVQVDDFWWGELTAGKPGAFGFALAGKVEESEEGGRVGLSRYAHDLFLAKCDPASSMCHTRQGVCKQEPSSCSRPRGPARSARSWVGGGDKTAAGMLRDLQPGRMHALHSAFHHL